MVTLQEIFNGLSKGVFSHVAKTDSSLGVLAAKNHASIVGHLNDALKALYKKFNLLQGSLVVHLQGLEYYTLETSKVSLTGVYTSDLYIEDKSFVPFADNIVQILEVRDSLQDEIIINDRAEQDAVLFQSHNTFKVNPLEIITDTLFFDYQAYLPKVELVSGSDLNSILIPIPTDIIPAIEFFIADAIFTPQGITTGKVDPESSQSISFHRKYLEECEYIKENCSVIVNTSSSNFADNGWI